MVVPRGGVFRFPRRGRTGRWRRGGVGRQFGPTAPAADGIRPVVRDVHARRLGPRCRRPSGCEVYVSGYWLIALGAVPLVGALVVAGLPTGRDLLAKQIALATSLATL